jgi:hypothetical protein
MVTMITIMQIQQHPLVQQICHPSGISPQI